MLFSINLIEIIPLYLINIYFFLVFFSVMLFSYASGRYILRKNYEDNLIRSALFSISIFAAIISIVLNLSPVLAKHIIIAFYLINLIILIINSKVRRDLYKGVVSLKFILAVIFIIFIIINIIYTKVIVENDNLIYFFDSHDSFFIDPIAEILKGDYFSRIKIFSLYPKEWGSYHFFEAGFNSIFLAPIYQSGTIGLIVLKNFYLSIFLTLFIFSFFKKESQINKKNYINFLIKLFLVLLLLFLIFYPKIIYFILTKNFISTLSIIFIVQSLLAKNKNDFLIWTIILSLSSFRNLIISFMLIIYYLIDTQYINQEIIIKRFKKIFNFPVSFLTIIFLFYLLSSFYQSQDISPKFHLPDTLSHWWTITITNSVIENYKYFFIIFIFLISTYFIQTKYLVKEKKVFFKSFNTSDLYYFALVLIIPFICLILLFFKNSILSFYNNDKLLIFFNSFNLKHIFYYFFPPIIWSIILLCCEIKIRIIFMLTIIFYIFLSIFIYNNIILPAIFTFEIMALFFVSHIFFNFKKIDNKNFLSYLFIFSILLISVFNFKIYHTAFFNHKNNTKLTFKLNDLKNLKQKEFLCPNDVKEINSHKDVGAALSGILFKPYYSKALIAEKYSNWSNIPLRYAVEPSNDVLNPCLD